VVFVITALQSPRLSSQEKERQRCDAVLRALSAPQRFIDRSPVNGSSSSSSSMNTTNDNNSNTTAALPSPPALALLDKFMAVRTPADADFRTHSEWGAATSSLTSAVTSSTPSSAAAGAASAMAAAAAGGAVALKRMGSFRGSSSGSSRSSSQRPPILEGLVSRLCTI
jgi:hypothetical protein